MWLIVSFTTARKCFVMLSYQSVKFFFYFEILKVVFFPPVSRASSNVQNCHWRILFLVRLCLQPRYTTVWFSKFNGNWCAIDFIFRLKRKQLLHAILKSDVYAATLPVHIKLRIKRKAVPSCLLPRLPLRVLPRLSSTLPPVVGFPAGLFSEAAGTH